MTDFTSRSLEVRSKQVQIIQKRYLDHAPVVLLPYSQDQPKLVRSKFIVAKGLTVGQFSVNLPEHLPLESNGKLFRLYLPSPSPITYLLTEICPSWTCLDDQMTIGKIYQEQKQEDGVLYLYYQVL